MKILFMGTPEPAAKCLQALIDAKQDVIAVITQPDRPKGRGLKLTASAVKQLALQYNITVHQPEKIKDPKSIELVKSLAPDLIVVVAYGKILPKEIINSPGFGAINVHASLLPKYRGAAPVQRALLNGEKETGITVQKVFEALDTGDIILQEKVHISGDDNTLTLTNKLFDAGASLLMKAIDLISAGKAPSVKQDPTKVSFAPMLKKETGVIDWKSSASEIFDQIRACNPWPVAYTYFRGKMLKIWSAETGLATNKYDPGEIIDCVRDEGFIVAAVKGTVFIKEVQLEGGRIMKAWEFIIGHKIKVGDVLPS